MNESRHPASLTPTQPSLILTPDEAALALKEFEAAKHAAELLHVTYPGHMWTAEMSGGCLTVRNLALHGQWGFVIHPHKHLDLDHTIRYAGGELLERWNVSRGAVGVDEAKQVLHSRMQRARQDLPDFVK